MKRAEYRKILVVLAAHPKFDSLPERLQEALTYMAAGYTDDEIAEMYKISHGTPWSYRESIFKRYGFKVYDRANRSRHQNGPTRAMTMEEIKIKLNIKV